LIYGHLIGGEYACHSLQYLSSGYSGVQCVCNDEIVG
jgi:hypothetical protein